MNSDEIKHKKQELCNKIEVLLQNFCCDCGFMPTNVRVEESPVHVLGEKKSVDCVYRVYFDLRD